MKSEVKISGNTIQITRIFDAPRHMVFGWWTEAEKLKQWSGCKEATNCEVEMDFRVGGTFTQKMTIAGHGEFSFTGKYDDIVVPEKISYTADLGHAVTHVLLEFFEQGNQTKLVLTHDGFPDEVSCMIVSQGTQESFDKLDSRLDGQAAASNL